MLRKCTVSLVIFVLVCPVMRGLPAYAGSTAGASISESVFPGCTNPPATPSGRVFYIDPEHGSANGSGSRERPWRTLAEVVSAGLFATMPTHFDNPEKRTIKQNPSAPIKPGDTIYLLSGDHGVVTIQGSFGKGLVGYDNSNFITIAALPGQTPVIERLSIIGGSKWVFEGITFQSVNRGQFMTAYNNVHADYHLVTLSGSHSDIVFKNDSFLSQPDTSDWTIKDWVERRASGISDSGGNCIAIVGNSFKNIGFGLTTQRSDKVLIASNTIDRFSDDGIDYGSNNLLIENNVITNSIEDGDGTHRDGMQGQPYNEQTTIENVTIKDNTVIRVTDPALPFPGPLQGIDAFDGTWNNVTVTGNTVITNAWDGISFFGAHHIVLSNNIVLPDGGRSLPCYNLRLEECLTKSVTVDQSPVPMLRVVGSKAKVPSSDVTMTNNIATRLIISEGTEGPINMSNNISVSGAAKGGLAMPVDGKERWFGKPGAYSGNNVITDVDAAGLFETYDPQNMKYNLTLRFDPRGVP